MAFNPDFTVEEEARLYDALLTFYVEPSNRQGLEATFEELGLPPLDVIEKAGW